MFGATATGHSLSASRLVKSCGRWRFGWSVRNDRLALSLLRRCNAHCEYGSVSESSLAPPKMPELEMQQDVYDERAIQSDQKTCY
jgi:hypothetical protein